MPLLTLADALLENASRFLGCYEDPRRENRSKCIDEIQSMFDPSRVDKGEAYCAKFVSNILNMTFPFLLKMPPLTSGWPRVLRLLCWHQSNRPQLQPVPNQACGSKMRVV